MKAAEENGVKFFLVDSEHSAIYQSLRGNDLSTLKDNFNSFRRSF